MIIHDCEQGTEEWFSIRAGKPTASMFSKLITSRGEPSKSMKDYAVTLAGELYAGKPLDVWEGNGWMERGKELEDAARTKYEMINNIDTVQLGFVTDDEEIYGCSPDSMVGDNGMLEIKCLKAENHIKAIMYFRKNERMPTAHVQQTQGQMFICDRKWCDIVFYHPDLPMLTIRSEPDEDVIKGLEIQINAVLIEREIIYGNLIEL